MRSRRPSWRRPRRRSGWIGSRPCRPSGSGAPLARSSRCAHAPPPPFPRRLLGRLEHAHTSARRQPSEQLFLTTCSTRQIKDSKWVDQKMKDRVTAMKSRLAAEEAMKEAMNDSGDPEVCSLHAAGTGAGFGGRRRRRRRRHHRRCRRRCPFLFVALALHTLCHGSLPLRPLTAAAAHRRPARPPTR